MLRCIHAYVVTESLHGMLRNKKEFLKLTNCPWVRNEHVTNEQRFIFFVWNGERFPLLLETNHAFRIVTQTYFNSEHAYDRFLCSQSLHGIVRNQERVSQAYETSVSKKRLHTKRTTLNFVVGNEQRFPLLLGTNNALRTFMVLSETKSAFMIKISQRYCLFTVWNSNIFSICFFGRLDFFFRVT